RHVAMERPRVGLDAGEVLAPLETRAFGAGHDRHDRIAAGLVDLLKVRAGGDRLMVGDVLSKRFAPERVAILDVHEGGDGEGRRLVRVAAADDALGREILERPHDARYPAGAAAVASRAA